MNLHEYQAKEIFKKYNLPVSTGFAVDNAKDALAACQKIDADKFVVKAQVHAGGRGKAGGVKLVDTPEQVVAFVEKMIGTKLVTYQTDEHGQPVSKVLIEACTDIEQEFYLGAVVDRNSKRITFMTSTEGGVEIEKVAHETPEKIFNISIDPLVGAQPFQAREVGFKLGLNPIQIKQFTKIFLGLAKMFEDMDLDLIEVNPLVITSEHNLHCLDAKLSVDGNALYRLPEIAQMRDLTQEDEREQLAAKWDLNYIALDGDIGCMVNGAGLAMATMDLIKLHGGNPANFLDVGGGATKAKVIEAFKLILSDAKVKGILVNIFGGIVQCDMIANGIIDAVAEVGISIPVVVRLEGTSSKLGSKLLSESGLNIIAAQSFDQAAQAIVKAIEVEPATA